MKTLNLIAFDSNDSQPRRILVLDEFKDSICDVFIDGFISFREGANQAHAIKDILTISENFMLFYNNLKTNR